MNWGNALSRASLARQSYWSRQTAANRLKYSTGTPVFQSSPGSGTGHRVASSRRARSSRSVCGTASSKGAISMSRWWHRLRTGNVLRAPKDGRGRSHRLPRRSCRLDRRAAAPPRSIRSSPPRRRRARLGGTEVVPGTFVPLGCLGPTSRRTRVARAHRPGHADLPGKATAAATARHLSARG